MDLSKLSIPLLIGTWLPFSGILNWGTRHLVTFQWYFQLGDKKEGSISGYSEMFGGDMQPDYIVTLCNVCHNSFNCTLLNMYMKKLMISLSNLFPVILIGILYSCTVEKSSGQILSQTEQHQ